MNLEKSLRDIFVSILERLCFGCRRILFEEIPVS